MPPAATCAIQRARPGRKVGEVMEPIITFSTRFVGGQVERSLTIRADVPDEVAAVYRLMYSLIREMDEKEATFQEAAQSQEQVKAIVDRAAIRQQHQERVRESQERARVRKNGGQPAGQVVCPQHGKAILGKWGLYCPTPLPEGGWCKWRPPGARKAAA